MHYNNLVSRSVEHQIDAIEQRLSNEILSGFKQFYLIMEGAVTTAKWYRCIMIVQCI